MSDSVKIFLCGRVVDLEDYGMTWRNEYSEFLLKTLENIELINPLDRNIDENDSSAVVQHDVSLIRDCDIVLLNATQNLIFGSPVEITLAKHFGKLVVSVVGENSSYFKKEMKFKDQTVKNWFHPFLKTFSDHIVNSLEEAVEIIRNYQENKENINIKTLKQILNE